MLLILPFRCYVHQKVTGELEKDGATGKSIYRLPWREFTVDLVAWLAIGMITSAFYLTTFKAPLSTGIKILIGCLSFGLFGGILSFLAVEKRIFNRLRAENRESSFRADKIFSVSTKILFFMIMVLLSMATVITLMIFTDINYLLTHKDLFGPDIYMGVFKEILFAFAVLVVLSFVIVRRYSQNIKNVLSIQVTTMEDIGDGKYDTHVPVVGNDEFGIIAAKTNNMMKGLKERDFCQLSFGRYVTPEVSEKILKEEISLEGELSQATIMFCDLRRYTTFVERKDPKDVVRFLNAYFTEMEQAIRKHNGIVLQYIGDEIEAVFGNPIQDPKHPEMAVRAALEMRSRLENLNATLEREGEDPASHGIGIHTGVVLAGSVGSPERLVYAMVGDAVNLASRIQNLNKKYKTDILISRATKELLPKETFALTNLGKARVRGKSEEIEIYSVL